VNQDPFLYTLFGFGAIAVMVMIFMSLYRAVKGPTAPDRVAAINIIGTKTLIVITLISRLYEQEFYLDIAVVYALMSFIATVGIAKYLEKGALE
jgi:multicomponent Na+:H+ antiporter subunit F